MEKARVKEKEKEKKKTLKDAPLFSVIVLTYLQRNFLEECLDSIFQQEYPNIEIVICDDCSADFDVKSVEDYIAENRGENIRRVVVYKQPENVGTVANAQKAIELSTGVYFKLHAGDDLLYNEFALTSVQEVLAEEDKQIVIARSIACQHDGTMTNHYYPSQEAFASMADADAEKQFDLIATQAWGEFVNAPAVFWKRDFFDRLGGMDLSYKYTEDWPMWLRITHAGYRLETLDEVTTVYRYGGISNDGGALNISLGKIHYQECIRMMREMVIPIYEATGSTMKVFRCKQCIRCIEGRISSEEMWVHWETLEHLIWRLKNLKLLLISWAYRKKKYGVVIQRRTQIIIMAICATMYKFHVQIEPSVSGDKLWAWGFFGAVLWLLAKEVFVFVIKLGNGGINLVKRSEMG